MSVPTLLIVEDDASQRLVITKMVREASKRHQLIEVSNGEEAMAAVARDKDHAIAAIFLDLYMPVQDGFSVLEEMHKTRPDTPVIVLTGSDDADDIERAMDLGAFDYIPKPPNKERIAVSLRNALESHTLHEEVDRLKRKDSGHTIFEDLIGYDKGLAQEVAAGRKAAQSDIPVLILGESGVGKEMYARAIHGESARAEKPFIAVNCGAIPENLVESTLFGHKKGSFTGAIADNPGKFREANGGTLFLDEVGELPHEVQVKLLRALQQKEIEPVGENHPVPVDVRIVSATNRDLEAEVNAGNFRQDLYFRLNVFAAPIKPLAERQSDIPDLVQYFIEKFAVSEHKTINNIADDAMQMLMSHQWSGNVRELENAVFRAVVLSEDDVIYAHDFHLGELATSSVQPENVAHIGQAGGDGLKVSLVNSSGTLKTMADLEWEIIQRAVEHCGGNVSKAAKLLDVGQSTLYRKINEHKAAS